MTPPEDNPREQDPIFEDPDFKLAGFSGVNVAEFIEQQVRQAVVDHPVTPETYRQWWYFLNVMKTLFMDIETRAKICQEVAAQKFREETSERRVALP